MIYFLLNYGINLLHLLLFSLFTLVPSRKLSKNRLLESGKVFQTRLLINTTANFLEPTNPLLRWSFQRAVLYLIDQEVILQLINTALLSILILLIPPAAEILSYATKPVTSLLSLVPISWNYVGINGFIDGTGFYYPYDILSLTLFAAGIILFLQKKWLWFYPVFMLACFNRESACFITKGEFLLTFQIGESKFFDILKSNKKMISQVIAQASI